MRTLRRHNTTWKNSRLTFLMVSITLLLSRIYSQSEANGYDNAPDPSSSSSDKDNSWPSGSYGIPCPENGCPPEKHWFSGARYHKTADINNMNAKSSQYHLVGPVTPETIAQVFCIKNSKTTEANTDLGSLYIWSPGKYCIYKYKICPGGFTEGSYTWDNTNPLPTGKNNASGALPDGVYTESMTSIQFCCRGDGYSNNPIRLPTKDPFYLFPFASTVCQAVENMRSTLEWVYFDDSDHANKNEVKGSVPYGPGVNSTYNTVLHFCYYIPSSLSNSSANYGAKYNQGGNMNGDSLGGSNSALGPIAGTLATAVGFFLAYKSTPLGGMIQKLISSTDLGGNIIPMINGVVSNTQGDSAGGSTTNTAKKTKMDRSKNEKTANDTEVAKEEDAEAAIDEKEENDETGA